MTFLRVFTVAWCPHCIGLLAFLDKAKIGYQNFDVDDDDQHWQEAMRLAGGQDIVPVVECKGSVAFGQFNAAMEKKIRDMIETSR